MSNQNETIVAPATAMGGAIAVIRLSGADALACCDRVFVGRKPLVQAQAYTVHYGKVVDGERVVDDVLATVFRAPHSYTGEDSVELSCHGSAYIVQEILRLLMAAGARMAQPGEFTIRAYMAGKMDLSQAEAVADLIACSSQAAHAMATTQMRGGYSSKLDQLRDELLKLTALLELELDFSEEDVEFADREQLRLLMEQIRGEIRHLSESFSLGNVIKEGVPVAIVGQPNVGKSTLLNCLLNEQRAMVSDIAGTTRDVIEEQTKIGGVVFRFLDTAGIRHTEDRLEQMGIERTMQSIEKAKIIIHMIDGRTLDAGTKIPVRADQTLVTVVNKMDLAPEAALRKDAIGISAKQGVGIDRLREALRQTVDTSALYHGDVVVSHSRHYEALTAAEEALHQALMGLENGLPADLLSEDIRQVIHHIGTITGRGEILSDEVLGHIFSKFCIGK